MANGEQTDLSGQLGWDVDDSLAFGHQPLRRGGACTARPFHRPTTLGPASGEATELAQPEHAMQVRPKFR